MIDFTHALPVSRQAELLELSRSNVYYLARPVAEADVVLMRHIDELHLNFPFAGARMLREGDRGNLLTVSAAPAFRTNSDGSSQPPEGSFALSACEIVSSRSHVSWPVLISLRRQWPSAWRARNTD